MPAEPSIKLKRLLQKEKLTAKKDKKKSELMAADRNDIAAYLALQEGLISGDESGK